jgi:hypothetical protein
MDSQLNVKVIRGKDIIRSPIGHLLEPFGIPVALHGDFGGGAFDLEEIG